MLFPSLIVCFLFTIVGHCSIPPSPDFNLTNATGNWNVAAFFSTEKDYGMTFYSNATLFLSVELFDIVKTSLTYNMESFYGVQINETLVSSPLNHAILISPYSPTPENEFVVTYYNSTSGECVAINSAMTVGIAISRNDNPYHNNFSSTITEIFNNLSLSLSNLTFVFNSNWDAQGLVPAEDEPFLLGIYYGSAIFTTDRSLQDLQCFGLNFNNMIDGAIITINFTHSPSQKSDIVTFSFASSLNIYASNQYLNFPALVVIYANFTSSSQSSTQIYAAATADRKYGFVFSNELPSQVDLTLAKESLVQNGLVINSTNFYEMPTVCQFNFTSFENILF